MSRRASWSSSKSSSIYACGKLAHLDPSEIIEHLGLQQHPEGGWFTETWRDEPEDGSRGAGTAIYFLLRAGERSQWHRVDATEVWHHYSGDALELAISADGGGVRTVVLGPDLAAGQAHQATVPAGAWQAARSLGEYTLVGCTVSPAFEFEHFELAPDRWEPGSASP